MSDLKILWHSWLSPLAQLFEWCQTPFRKRLWGRQTLQVEELLLHIDHVLPIVVSLCNDMSKRIESSKRPDPVLKIRFKQIQRNLGLTQETLEWVREMHADAVQHQTNPKPNLKLLEFIWKDIRSYTEEIVELQALFYNLKK